MKITEELVDYCAALSRLALEPAEKAKITAELERILDYMDVLGALDTDEIAPMCHVFPLKNRMRPDAVMPSTDRAALLANAPIPHPTAFLVPKTVE